MPHKNQSEQLQQLLKRNGEFIAQFEISQEKLEKSQTSLANHAAIQQQNLNDQLAALEQQTNAIHQLMTEAGAARFRIIAEENLRQGEIHIENLNAICEQQNKNFKHQQIQLESIATEYMQELQKTETSIAKNINSFLKRLNIEEMRELADQARTTIETSAADAIFKSNKLLRKFHWKNIAFILIIVFLNSIAMGLYLNHEMPWEIHKHAMLERHTGQAVLDAWPSLEDKAKHLILAHSKYKLHEP